MIEDLEVAIPTLFRPVTLEPLLETLKEQGVTAIRVIEGKPVNDAWRQAMAEAKRRYLMILNDDIAVSGRFVNEMLYAHGIGYTYVYAHRTPRFSGASRVTNEYLVRGCHLGEAFSLDMTCAVPPIPEEFKIYHGDDWLFWQHNKHGRCGEATSAEYKTEESYSGKHPDIDGIMRGWFGKSLDAIGRDEHLASRKYFEIPNGVRWLMEEAGIDYTVTATDTNRAFMGSAAGLKE